MAKKKVVTKKAQAKKVVTKKSTTSNKLCEGEMLSGAKVRTALIDGVGFYAKAVQYVEVDGLAIFEGDIVLGTCEVVERNTEVRRQEIRSGVAAGVVITGADRRWINCVVPYTIDPSLPNQERVTDAIAHWESNSNYTFIERTPANAAQHPDWVTFRPSSGCSSSVGRRGGQQFLNLAPGCSTGNTIHEIGHTIGLWHEQSREDRDAFVTINFDKIIPGRENNFLQQITDGDDVGAYDYGSIMHYPRDAFSIDGSDTITPVDPNATIGQRTALSAGDIAAANSLCAPQLPFQPFTPFPFQPFIPRIPFTPVRPFGPFRPLLPRLPFPPIRPFVPRLPFPPIRPFVPRLPFPPIRPFVPRLPFPPIRPVVPRLPFPPIRPFVPRLPFPPIRPVLPRLPFPPIRPFVPRIPFINPRLPFINPRVPFLPPFTVPGRLFDPNDQAQWEQQQWEAQQQAQWEQQQWEAQQQAQWEQQQGEAQQQAQWEQQQWEAQQQAQWEQQQWEAQQQAPCGQHVDPSEQAQWEQQQWEAEQQAQWEQQQWEAQQQAQWGQQSGEQHPMPPFEPPYGGG